jgi:hypothetical protein
MIPLEWTRLIIPLLWALKDSVKAPVKRGKKAGEGGAGVGGQGG